MKILKRINFLPEVVITFRSHFSKILSALGHVFVFFLSDQGPISRVLSVQGVNSYWVAVRQTYVFTLQEVEKICRTLQSHVILA